MNKNSFLVICCLFFLTPLQSMILKIEKLSLRDKIAQLFMATAVCDDNIASELIQKKPYPINNTYTAQLIKEYKIGGIIFLGKSNYEEQQSTTAYFQNMSTIPLLIGQDLEPGRVGAARLSQFAHFPSNQKLGIDNDINITKKLGITIGKICKDLGVHINFAPVADVNNNPNNPVINDRSFGDSPEIVTSHAIAFYQGLASENIIACAKHFPGHGDTSVDSHHALPCIPHTTEHLDDIELAPFKALIAAGIPTIMMGHLAVPALEKEKNLPASLSKKIIVDLLQKELGFTGLIISDALDMNGVTQNRTDNVALLALMAGNDILLCSTNIPKAINAIENAIKQGIMAEEELDKHVEKILNLKNKIFYNTD